jgi:hemolysin III
MTDTTAPATIRIQTAAEELANSITHGIGAALGVAALTVLVVYASLAGDPWRIVSTSVYGASLVLLFLASTLYHSFRKPRVKYVFQVLDHAAIFLLIAGTYTPFALVTLRGPWGWTLFGIVWGLAVLGIAFEAGWMGRFPRLSTALYLLMGWVGVLVVWPLWQTLPLGGWGWLVAGGLAYTVGVVFFAWERLPYHHTLWHLFVLAGAACHFFAVFGYVVPVV